MPLQSSRTISRPRPWLFRFWFAMSNAVPESPATTRMLGSGVPQSHTVSSAASARRRSRTLTTSRSRSRSSKPWSWMFIAFSSKTTISRPTTSSFQPCSRHQSPIARDALSTSSGDSGNVAS